MQTKLIAFEGDDGVGKTTLAKRCEEMLVAEGKTVLRVHTEALPPYAKQLRDIIVSDAMSRTSANVRALMFSSWLLNIDEELIRPNWNKYDYIIMDRTYLSTLVYQFDSDLLEEYGKRLAVHLPINILVYLECGDEVGLERIRLNRDAPMDVFEKTSTLEVIQGRKAHYNDLIHEGDFNTVIRVDASPDAETVAESFKQQLFTHVFNV